jgi:hypothetical protein
MGAVLEGAIDRIPAIWVFIM